MSPDNLFQHRARADLISKIQNKEFAIVSEHLVSGSVIAYSGSLLEDLETIGFNKKLGVGQFMKFYTKNLRSLICPSSGVTCQKTSIIFMKEENCHNQTPYSIIKRSVLTVNQKTNFSMI